MNSKIRFLSFMVALLLCGSGAVWGQTDFNPSNPSEPGAPPVKVTLLVEPREGGSVSGGGKYVPESNVTVTAYASQNFRFAYWSDAGGNVVSEQSRYSFAKGSVEDVLTAHFEYDPGSPAEPVPGEMLAYYHLSVQSGGGGTVSGGGRYQAGKTVWLYAYCDDKFEFVSWTDESGDVVSTSRSFGYTTKTRNETLRANFRYNPGSPEEPADPVLRHRIRVACGEGGTASANSQVLLEGSSTYLNASPNAGYKFMGWYVGGELYTMLRSFSYTMGENDIEFEARFEFNPDNPAEPSQPSDKKYAMYLMSEVTYPGTVVNCPLYLTSLDDLGDMTFRLTFAEGLVLDFATLVLGDKAEGYTVSVADGGEKGVYVVTLIGGRAKAGNQKLLTLKVGVPDATPVGSVNQVKINQVSVTETDGQTVTASTRNGKVQVFELGDSNGDGVIDVTDKMNIVLDVFAESPEDYLPELTDVNEDGVIDVSDAMRVVTKVIDKNE